MMIITLLTLYGSSVLTAMMIFYILESKSYKYTLLFAIACFFSSSYGFLSGVYPFGVIEFIWGIFALNRFRNKLLKK
jgi:hypothetical protein